MAVVISIVGIIVAAVIATFIQQALEHWVIDYFGSFTTLTLESIALALVIMFALPFALAAAFGYFLVLAPTVYAPSRQRALSYGLVGIVIVRVLAGLVASLSAIASGVAHWALLPQPDVFTVSPLFPVSMLVAVAAGWKGRIDALAETRRAADARRA
jgi:hypothetical protein